MKNDLTILSKENRYFQNVEEIIHNNLREEISINGLKCYDLRDILESPVFEFLTRKRLLIFVYFLRVVDKIFPKLMRFILRIKPVYIPTASYHLGLAVLDRGIDNNLILENAIDYAQKYAVHDHDYMYWLNPMQVHCADWKDDDYNKDDNTPLSCAHHTARLGYLYWKLYKRTDDKAWLQKSILAANSFLKFHKWFSYDNCCAVSYYPNSTDEVINTSAEVAVLFSCLAKNNNEFKEKTIGIINLVLKEQTTVGEWRYATKAHEARFGAAMGPDSHHHCMVITSLSRIAMEGTWLPKPLKEVIYKSIKLGSDYYLNNFIDAKGKCSYFQNSAKNAGMGGCAEAVIGMISAFEICKVWGDEDKATEYLNAAALILSNTIERFCSNDKKTITSDIWYGVPYRIGSIRWGGGLLLDALAHYNRAVHNTSSKK